MRASRREDRVSELLQGMEELGQVFLMPDFALPCCSAADVRAYFTYLCFILRKPSNLELASGFSVLFLWYMEIPEVHHI